jgi:hypothetical protein
VKAVHGDVHALIEAGLLERDATGLVVFPFDAVRVDFTLAAARTRTTAPLPTRQMAAAPPPGRAQRGPAEVPPRSPRRRWENRPQRP